MYWTARALLNCYKATNEKNYLNMVKEPSMNC